MTSGIFETVDINKIWVNREERQRRDLSDLSDLTTSIAKVGLINPPVVDRDYQLRAGERRWGACRALGWTAIPVQWVDELDPLQLHLLELDENIRRRNLPWQDEVAAIAKYNELRKQIDPEWNAERTAEAIGLDATNVSKKIAVAKAIEAGNERVINSPVYSTALGIVQRDEARAKSSILNNISFAAPKGESALEMPSIKPVPLLHLDFHEWALDYTGPKFNFIHCDFPYGVGMDKSDQGAGDGHGTYEDTPDVYWALINTLREAMFNVVAESAHLMFWFSMDFYEETRLALEAMGWKVAPFPLIWYKSDNTGILPDPKRGPRRIYETAFHASRGDRLVTNSVSNVCAHPSGDKELHMNEKPVKMLHHFMRMFVDGYSLVLDPTAGSANALKAAQQLNANFVLGLERDTEFFTRSTEMYYAGV